MNTTLQPLVSIAVIAYNSAKYILETLESIKAQTYNHIELIISDDCSTDNTISLCQLWTKENKDRFVNIKIVQSPINTGQSGNYNRAFDACAGEWIKEIDGDDKLLPNCIASFIKYTNIHPDAMYIFGKTHCFGGDAVLCQKKEKYFEYSMFLRSPADQLHYLLYEGNFIPSIASFYNKEYILSLGFRNDERIPLIEDYPKWIRLLDLGVNFHFLDEYIANYRINCGVSNTPISIAYRKSLFLVDLYYRYPHWLQDGDDSMLECMADNLLSIARDYERLKETHAYRLGKLLLAPFTWLKGIKPNK